MNRRREILIIKMDPKFIEIARNEIGETELKKSQSLAQFREWLSKHPFLKDARQGKQCNQREVFPQNLKYFWTT